MKPIGEEFKRGDDDILEWRGGRSYREPGEAIKTFHNGVLRLGCNARVFSMWSSSPCGKAPKHDPDDNGRPTKCGLHCAAAVKKREAKKDATSAKWRRQWRAADAVSNAEEAVEAALVKIAAGHNDPRSLAQETLEALATARAEKEEAHRQHREAP